MLLQLQPQMQRQKYSSLHQSYIMQISFNGSDDGSSGCEIAQTTVLSSIFRTFDSEKNT